MQTKRAGLKEPVEQAHRAHIPEQDELKIWDELASDAGVESGDCEDTDPPFTGWLDAELLATLSGAMRELWFIFIYQDRFTSSYIDYLCGVHLKCIGEAEITLGVYEGILDACNRCEKGFEVTVPMEWLREADSARSLADRIYSSACWTLSNTSHSDVGDDDSDDEPSHKEIGKWHQSRTAGLYSAIKGSN